MSWTRERRRRHFIELIGSLPQGRECYAGRIHVLHEDGPIPGLYRLDGGTGLTLRQAVDALSRSDDHER